MYHCFIKFLKGLYTLYFLFSIVVLVNAQDDTATDSLLLLLNNAKGSSRVDVLVSLTIELANSTPGRSLELIKQAHQLSLEIGDSARIVRCGRIRGELLRRNENVIEAIKILKDVLPVAKRNNYDKDFRYILNSLALIYTFQANYDKALSYNFESLLVRERSGNKFEVSITLNNIGLVYFKLKNYEKALEYYKRCLKLKREIKDEYDLDGLLINIGLSYNQLGNYELAKKYVADGLAACGDDCSMGIKTEGQFGLGLSFYGENNYKQAIKHFTESYRIAKEEKSKRFQLENLVYLAKIYIVTNESFKAADCLAEAERIAIGTEYNQLLIEIYKAFSNLYNKSQNFEKAALYQERYISLKDSIYSETLIKNLAKIQTDYEQRENTAIIATKEETIQRQRNLNIAVAIIALLCVLLVFVLYHSNKVKKRVNQALSDAKAFIELKNKELDKKVADKTLDLEVANQSLVKVNEELDNFIYKTSHDIRGPLASLKGICNVALLDVKDDVAVSYLHKLDLTAEHLNSILTRLLIINQINNSSMKSEAVDFKAIIDEIIRLELKKGMPLKIRVDKEIQEGIQYFSDREFVRIIFENLISNAVKFHNNSERAEPFIKIRVETRGEEIHIHVLDNGIGIREVRPDKLFQMFSRASERSSTGGIGLYITKTATEKLGGRVGLKVTPEGYTEFFIRFPVVPPRMA